MDLGIHEAIELHELLVHKTNCLAKAKMMSQVVEDPQLRGVIQNDIQSTTAHIQQLQEFLVSSQFNH